jgi:hypothetical protein
MTASYHSHAPWRKAILIPFWTLQLGFELLLIGVVAVAAGYLSHYEDDSSYVVDENGTIYQVDNHALNITEHRYGILKASFKMLANFLITESFQFG